MRAALLALPLLLLATVCSAQTRLDSPVGRWLTFDDDTGAPDGVIEIREVNGELQGRIAESLQPDPNDPNPICSRCPGDKKDQPVLGLTFLWGLKRDGNEWTGGRVLDPRNGEIYRAKIALADGGRKLRIRGYLGISLLGRTQTWVRQE
jgi:uncharacterized protein (DUF2147 family)